MNLGDRVVYHGRYKDCSPSKMGQEGEIVVEPYERRWKGGSGKDRYVYVKFDNGILIAIYEADLELVPTGPEPYEEFFL